MAVVLGTNCGFVTAAPTNDPAGTNLAIQTSSYGVKDTAPEGATKITKIGWWCDNATEEANFEVGLYDHNATDNEPEARLQVSATNAKGTTAGWKSVVVDWTITAGTIYWIAVQLDNTATGTNENYSAGAGRLARLYGQTALINPWGTSSALNDLAAAIYAVYEVAAGGSGKMTLNTRFWGA